MKERDPITFLSLTGGLGNQLFQLAAGLALSPKNLEVITYFGAPRTGISGSADIFDFALPGNVLVSAPRNADVFSQKVAGFILRNGIQPRSFERVYFVRKAILIISEIVLSIKVRVRIVLRQSNNVGYSEVQRVSKSSLLIGYFQSYRWASEKPIFESLQALRLCEENSEVKKYKDLAQVECPLAIHVRLGDYRNEASFGILPHTYYLEAISRMSQLHEYRAIWLFSDELAAASEVVPQILNLPVRLIPMVSNSSAATLEVMRFCKGYIIANSSFSWWGAFLSYTSNAEIFAPRPWFKGMEDPKDLNPPHWNLVDV